VNQKHRDLQMCLSSPFGWTGCYRLWPKPFISYCLESPQIVIILENNIKISRFVSGFSNRSLKTAVKLRWVCLPRSWRRTRAGQGSAVPSTKAQANAQRHTSIITQLSGFASSCWKNLALKFPQRVTVVGWTLSLLRSRTVASTSFIWSSILCDQIILSVQFTQQLHMPYQDFEWNNLNFWHN